jgi:hypothetical protein
MARLTLPFMLLLTLTGCDASESGEGHWMAYATAKSGRIEWLFLNTYQTAADCDHAARYNIDKVSGDVYRYPAGCVYASNSQWLAYVVNTIYGVMGYSDTSAMECMVARSTRPDAEKISWRYSPVTKGSGKVGATYYCVM